MAGVIQKKSALLQNYSHQSYINTTFPYTGNTTHSFIDSFRISPPPQQPSNRSLLFDQIKNLHILNNELYRMIDLIHSSFFSESCRKNQHEKSIPLNQLQKKKFIDHLTSLQRQMRDKFAKLIKNMKDFYTEIDGKLRKIGEMFKEQCESFQYQTNPSVNPSVNKSPKKDCRPQNLSIIRQNRPQICEADIKRSLCQKKGSSFPNKHIKGKNSDIIIFEDLAVDESIVTDSLKILENKKADIIKQSIRNFHAQPKHQKGPPLQLLKRINIPKEESSRKSLKSILMRADKIKNSAPHRSVSQNGRVKIS